jgi:cytoskeletal protein CcmA (bactofilin family)
MADREVAAPTAPAPLEASSRGASPVGFAEAPVAVPAGGTYRGLLCFHGAARVDGDFEGVVIAGGTLWVGETAVVRARIEVDELIVAGLLDGEVRARSRIELLATGRVRGALCTPRLALADGCILQGRCHTGPDEHVGEMSTSGSP